MKKVGKKILTGVITAGMVLSAMSMSAFAAEGGEYRLSDGRWHD